MAEKKSWPEMKQVVTDLRKQLTCLSVSLPSSISFRTFNDGRERIYFLSTPTNGWEMTLLFVDINPTDNGRHLKWLSLVDPKMVVGGVQFSREEQLQWERKRLSTWGITSYELHAASGRMVFPAASTLYYCWDYGFGNGVLNPTELQGCPAGAKLSPQICPTNPNIVAYVNNSDIWVSICSSEVSERLTFTNKPGVSAGDPSYVMQEEFNRYIGFWWQPVKNDKMFRILYELVDESMVGTVRFESTDGEGSEKLRFPRAGTTNAKSELNIVQFAVTDCSIVDVKTFVMRTPLFDLFPWAEYLVRAGWTPDGNFIWVQLIDRRQIRFEMALIPLSDFIEEGVVDNGDDNSPTAPIHIIDSQRSDIWINVHDMLAFLPYDCKTQMFSFVIASEETAFRHLYLIQYPLGIEDNNPARLKSLEAKRIALTSGDWAVVGKQIWLDASRQLVYFLGQRETPLEEHIYVVSLRQPGCVRLLTVIGNSYNVSFNEDCTLAVITYSNAGTYPACEILRIVHRDWTVDGISLISAGCLLESIAAPEKYCPTLHSYQISSGDLLFAMVLKPHKFEAGRKYPTVLHIYGGPEVQLVTNTFKGMRQLRTHMLAAQGYCVVTIDSRGSQHRGLAFEGHIKGRMGTVELADQVEVLHYLSSKLGFIDMSRIAIHGWSYGGYLSLMALVQHPQTFKVAIAGAPVTSWHLYDTAYTERYMDMPYLNPLGYKIGSVLNWVKQFPDEDNRLLIIHGLIDENVHFKHTSDFVSALIKEGKPYHLQVYPHERHSLRSIDASKHYETKLLLFLQNFL